jgi:tRNA(adenine34) deaminase
MSACEAFVRAAAARHRQRQSAIMQGSKQGFMDAALAEAEAAAARGEVPVGAVIVRDGTILARAGNRTLEYRDPTAHAEILAIRMACEAVGSQRLADCDLYVTLEPCPMCAAAISFARIRRLYFGADDPKGGAVENGVRFFGDPTCHHAPEVYSGMAEKPAAHLLRDFFARKR